jgi:hypothetical protein
MLFSGDFTDCRSSVDRSEDLVNTRKTAMNYVCEKWDRVHDESPQTTSYGVISAQTPHGTCNANEHATGFDTVATQGPPWSRLIKPQGRTLLPERSKLFKSPWSNQWLTSKIALDRLVSAEGHRFKRGHHVLNGLFNRNTLYTRGTDKSHRIGVRV